MSALPDTITTDDDPKISEALSVPEPAHLVLDIDEDVDTLVENET